MGTVSEYGRGNTVQARRAEMDDRERGRASKQALAFASHYQTRAGALNNKHSQHNCREKSLCGCLCAMAPAVMEEALLLALNSAEKGSLESEVYAAAAGIDPKALVGVIKSLSSYELIEAQAVDHRRLVLTDEAKSYLGNGSPEVCVVENGKEIVDRATSDSMDVLQVQVFRAVPEGGISLAEIQAKLGPELAGIGFKQVLLFVSCLLSSLSHTPIAWTPTSTHVLQAMQSKWLTLQKGEKPLVMRKVDSVEDNVQALLAAADRGESLTDAQIDVAKKRKLLTSE
jgi:phenylalanyl-tRNA synthetase alpha chain